jgi:hypothetical protein
MPPKGKLPAETISLLTSWVIKGMPWTAEVINGAPSADKSSIRTEHKNYLSYCQSIRHPFHSVSNTHSTKNNTDELIISDLDAHDLAPAPLAEKTTLIRRAYYDLTGLTPSVDEVSSFIAEDAIRPVVGVKLAA